MSDNNLANLSHDWPDCVCVCMHNVHVHTMKRRVKKEKNAMKMFVFTQPLISTLCLHYWAFSLSVFSSFSPFLILSLARRTHSHLQANEYTALFQNLKHLLYIQRVYDLCHGIKLKMSKKGAQPSVQISIKIKEGKQFCRWLLLMLMLLLFFVFLWSRATWYWDTYNVHVPVGVF